MSDWIEEDVSHANANICSYCLCPIRKGQYMIRGKRMFYTDELYHPGCYKKTSRSRR